MTPEERQKLLDQKATEIGQYNATKPQAPDTANDPILQAQRGQHADKVRELFTFDREVADKYANKDSSVYLEDPYAREKARAIHSEGAVNSIANIMQNMGTRKDELNDAWEKGYTMWQMGLKAKQEEHDVLSKNLSSFLALEERKEAAKEKAEKKQKESALQTMLEKIGILRDKRKESKNAINKTGVTKATGEKAKQDIMTLKTKLQQENPNQEIQVKFKKRADGKYDYSITSKGRPDLVTDEERNNPEDVVRSYMEDAISQNPDQAELIAALVENRYPQVTEGGSTVDAEDRRIDARSEVQKSIREAGQQALAQNRKLDPEELYAEIKSFFGTILTDEEIRTIMKNEGYAVPSKNSVKGQGVSSGASSFPALPPVGGTGRDYERFQS